MGGTKGKQNADKLENNYFVIIIEITYYRYLAFCSIPLVVVDRQPTSRSRDSNKQYTLSNMD